MFGNKEGKNVSTDEAKRRYEIITNIANSKGRWGANVEEMEISRKQMTSDLSQVKNNIKNVVEQASENVDNHNQIVRKLEDYLGAVKCEDRIISDVYNSLVNQKDICQLVEKKEKDYDNLSEKMAKDAEDIEISNKLCTDEIDGILDLSQNMELLSLNIAVEASRLGDNGLPMVQNVEKMRELSLKYADSTKQVKEMLETTNQKIEEAKSLISEMAQELKKRSGNTDDILRVSSYAIQKLENVNLSIMAEDISSMKELMIKAKNIDEEIARSQERSLMQVDDIDFEVTSQKNATKEIISVVEPIFEEEFEEEYDVYWDKDEV